jgi:7,8-dihydroneopterin aldolase/epimerase/oxygenase
MDKIHIQKIRAYGYIGFLPEEQVLGQWFEVNVTLGVDLQTPGKSDQLEDTIDYCQAIAIVKKIVTTEKFCLIERLAQAIADQLLSLDKINFVQIQVIKQPPIPDFGGQVMVEIIRNNG